MTERRAILMFCLGGQRTGLLAKSLYLGGMSLGNGDTGWKESDYQAHTEHSEITQLMGIYNTITPNIEEQTKAKKRLIEILRAYRTQAEEKDWKYYGIKTTAGICRNKWDDIKEVYFEEWPNSWYFSLVRKPPKERDYEGWHNVFPARMELAETRNAVFLPYPEVYMTGEIKKFILTIGLHYKDEVMELFNSKRYREGTRNFVEDDTRLQYEYLMELSRRNFRNLFGETLELRGE